MKYEYNIVRRNVVVNMGKEYITAGEFAKLASTTKRTVVWYDRMGILKPDHIDTNGYRLYLPEQILDFQAILLLRKLNFSIEEIKGYLAKDHSMRDLFRAKRKGIEREIYELQEALTHLDEFFDSLDQNGILVKPEVKNVYNFEIYYIEKVGSYVKIKEYDKELASYFVKLPNTVSFLTIFLDSGYRPAKSRMKVGVVVEEGMEIKEEYKHMVRKETISEFKALSYTYKGSGSLLSLLWKELEKYAKKNGYIQNTNLPFVDIEFYRNTTHEENQIEFEINLPIK